LHAGLFIYMKGLPDFQWFWHLLEKTEHSSFDIDGVADQGPGAVVFGARGG
jgi:hypothetical protein